MSVYKFVIFLHFLHIFKELSLKHAARQARSSALPFMPGLACDFDGNDAPVFQIGWAGFSAGT